MNGERKFIWVGLGATCLVLAVIVFSPLFRKRHEAPTRRGCSSNLRQIGQGLLLYTNDHGPQYPPTLELLIEMAELSPGVFVCPSAAHRPAAGATTREIVANFRKDPKAHCSYVYLGATMHANLPAEHVVAYEPPENHCGEGMNVLYNDGHVEWADAAEAKWIISELSAGRNPPATRPSSTTRPTW